MTAANHRWVLSGGLASGKTMVRELLADHGIATIDADSVGHSVIAPEGPAFSEVVGRWPTVADRGEIDRSALAAIVFNDEEELAALETITHPYIFDSIKRWVEENDEPVVVEMPIFHHGLGPRFKRIVVDCSDPIRLERAAARGMSRQDALARMEAQPSRSEWLASADIVVPNHSTTDELRSTITRVIPKL